MKSQWNLLLALIVVLIIAIFSVINVEPVTVNYLFGKAEWPLILVIISSPFRQEAKTASQSVKGQKTFFRVFMCFHDLRTKSISLYCVRT